MKQNRLLEDPVRSVFLSYLVPSVSATLVTSIYILADTMMIGRGIGSVGIAALNILLPLYSTFFGFVRAKSVSTFHENISKYSRIYATESERRCNLKSRVAFQSA